SVEGSGPGIRDELVPRVFESFERGGTGQGSGLGLAIARAYARAHGGDLVYDPVGRGARFELFVPATDEREQRDVDLVRRPPSVLTAETLLHPAGLALPQRHHRT